MKEKEIAEPWLCLSSLSTLALQTERPLPLFLLQLQFSYCCFISYLKIPFSFFNDFKSGICSFKSPEIQAGHFTKQTGKVQWRHLSASQHQTPQPVRYFLITVPSFVPKTPKNKILIVIQHFLTRIPWWIVSDWLFFSATCELSMLRGGMYYVFKWCIAAVNKH